MGSLVARTDSLDTLDLVLELCPPDPADWAGVLGSLLARKLPALVARLVERGAVAVNDQLTYTALAYGPYVLRAWDS